MNAEEKVYHERFMREAIKMVNRSLQSNAPSAPRCSLDNRQSLRSSAMKHPSAASS
jgi:hypothetical protein